MAAHDYDIGERVVIVTQGSKFYVHVWNAYPYRGWDLQFISHFTLFLYKKIKTTLSNIAV